MYSASYVFAQPSLAATLQASAYRALGARLRIGAEIGLYPHKDGTARLGLLFGPEERLKIEAQPTYWRTAGENWLMSLCFSALITADLTFRTIR